MKSRALFAMLMLAAVSLPVLAQGPRRDGRWESVSARASGLLSVPDADSLDAFIVEHYWGYSRGRDASTVDIVATADTCKLRMRNVLDCRCRG